jgi:serine/threonine protein kinase
MFFCFFLSLLPRNRGLSIQPRSIVKTRIGATMLFAAVPIPCSLQGAKGTTYNVGRRLGSGGFGAVHLCSTQSGETIAVKFVVSDALAMPAIAALTKVRHKLIAPVLDGIVIDLASVSVACIVMPFYSGGTLHELCNRRRFDLKQAEFCLYSLMQASEFLHEKQIIHGDIKPDNVLVERTPRGNILKLTDYGLMRVCARTRIQPITFLGTQGYSPPRDGTPNSLPAWDIYSLGATFLDLITGLCGLHDIADPTVFVRALGVTNGVRAYEIFRILTQPYATRPQTVREARDALWPVPDLVPEQQVQVCGMILTMDC